MVVKKWMFFFGGMCDISGWILKAVQIPTHISCSGNWP